MNGLKAGGLNIKIVKYRFRLWKYGFEYGTNIGGKWYLFPWAPSNRKK